MGFPSIKQVLSGRKVRVMAKPDERVSVVRQRVEKHLGTSEFQEMKLFVGVEEVCYDVSLPLTIDYSI